MSHLEHTVLRLNRSSFPELVATVLAGVTTIWGLLLILTPNHFAGHTFDVTFDVLPPAAWGTLMLLVAMRMVFSVWGHGQSVGWALLTTFVAVVLWSTWGITVTLSLPGGGLPPLASLTLGSVNLLLALLYAVERRTAQR